MIGYRVNFRFRDLDELSWDGVDKFDLTHNRDKWWVLVGAAMNVSFFT